MLKPLRPPARALPAPRVPGRYKVEPEDFVVDEIPAYAPSGSGTHLLFKIEKRGISTHDAVLRFAKALGRDQRDIGFAGLKDAQAVATQWLSVEHVEERAVRAVADRDLRVLETGWHGNKLRAGHLRGNRFRIVLRGATAEHLPHLRLNLADLERRGTPNWFGEQRFGKRGANLDKGLRVLLAPQPRHALRAVPRHLQNLVLSAVQSEAFNRVLARRLETIDTLLDGDVAFLHRNGAAFLVESALAEQARCASFEISPTGPLPGPKCLQPAGEPARIEQEVLAELEITHEHFGRLPRDSHPGARRPLRIAVVDASAELDANGLAVAFTLPAGAYATAVLRELLAEAPWFGDGDQ